MNYINQYIDFNVFLIEVPENGNNKLNLVLTTYNTIKKLTKQQITGESVAFTQTGFENNSNNTESNVKQSYNLKKSKKFEEKRNNMKAKTINKNKVENMENIMKELNDNFEEKDNDIDLSIIDNSKNLRKMSSMMCNDDQILFNNHSDNEIILESIRLLI